MLDSIATILGVKKSAMLVGFASAVLSLKFMPAMVDWYQKASTVAGGWLCAIYIAPAIAEIFEFKERTEYGIVFLVGLLGMSMVAAILALITSGELWRFIKQRFGGGAS
jgi:hypothetical protein